MIHLWGQVVQKVAHQVMFVSLSVFFFFFFGTKPRFRISLDNGGVTGTEVMDGPKLGRVNFN